MDRFKFTCKTCGHWQDEHIRWGSPIEQSDTTACNKCANGAVILPFGHPVFHSYEPDYLGYLEMRYHVG